MLFVAFRVYKNAPPSILFIFFVPARCPEPRTPRRGAIRQRGPEVTVAIAGAPPRQQRPPPSGALGANPQGRAGQTPRPLRPPALE